MTRITVTPAEEDEVIVAGLPAEQTPEPARFTGIADESSAEAASVGQTGVVGQDSNGKGPSAVEQASAAKETAATSAKPSATVESASVSTAAPEPAIASTGRRKAKDEYHETTLEDLEPTKMPFAQRVVIVAAVLCIIGALVYYFVAMR